MEKEMPGLSERMSKVEGILEQMSDRLNHIESRMDSEFTALRAEMNSGLGELRGEIRELRGEIRELRGQMSTQFRWILAFIMGMWVTVIVAILFK